jgi:hypothetical protein
MSEKNEELSRVVTTEEHSFDELARGVADGTLSRGEAVKSVFAAILGGLLGMFALPPREAEARQLKTLWAIVAGDGTLLNGKGALEALDRGTGRYVVTFNRNVNNCAYSVTTTGGFAGDTGAENDTISDQSVIVYTATSTGTNTELPFYLVVNC